MQKIKNFLYKKLRLSEKYTKTDTVYLAKGGFWLTINNVISSIVIFVLAIAFANLLPKEIYGTYKYVISIMGIFSVATLRGFDSIVTQAVAKGVEGVLIPSVKISIHWGILGSLASILTAIYYYINSNPPLFYAFLLVALFIPVFETFNLYNSYLNGKKLFKVSAIIGTVSQVFATIAMAITILLTDNLFLVLFVYFSSWTIIRFSALQIVLHKFPPNQNYDPDVIPYGKHTSFVGAVSTAIGSVDSVLLFHYLGPTQLAIYSFALAPIFQLNSTIKQLPILAIPKFAGRPIKNINELLFKRFTWLFMTGLAIAIIYIIFAPYIFKLFFPKYIDAILFSQVFSFIIPITLAQSILGAAVTSRATMIPKKMLYLWNTPSALFTGSMFLLIPWFGIIGVLIAKFLSSLSITIVSLIMWKKIVKIDQERQLKNSTQKPRYIQ